MVGSLIVRPTKREDLRVVQPAEPWNAGWRELDRDGMEGWLQVYARTFVERTSGNPLAVVGIVVLFPGVAEAWACIDPRIEPHKLSFCREVRKLKEFAFKELGLWRIQAPIQETFEKGRRFVEVFGLQPEARLESWFHPDEAVILYREVRK